MAMRVGGRDRRSVTDLERARLIGEEFGLGALQKVMRNRKFPLITVGGAALVTTVLIAGLPVALGVASGPYQTVTKAVVGGVTGGLLLLGCLMAASGAARSRVIRRLFRYSGGLAQLIDDEPEPRVVRWADVDSLTVSYFESEETSAHLTSFWLRSATGTQLPGLRWYGRSQLRDTVTAISRAVAPHLVPAMIETYASGQPVVFGPVHVGQEAINVDAWSMPWSGIRLIGFTYVPKSPVYKIKIYETTWRIAREIDISGIPNGVFLPHLLAYAATRNGVPLEGYEDYRDPVPAPACERRLSRDKNPAIRGPASRDVEITAVDIFVQLS